MGTGGQVSVFSPDFLETETLETRPFPDGGWLLVGASLCGGRSYALLESFFRETVKMVTGEEHSAYAAMEQALDSAQNIDNLPKVSTLFQGTRSDPSQKAGITELTADNFTPVHLMLGLMQGMAEELHSMYEGYLKKGGTTPTAMIGSGNGLRRNKHLRRIFQETFNCPLILSENQEEAACGAAIYAAKHLK
jgi:sedoheptulokinase